MGQNLPDVLQKIVKTNIENWKKFNDNGWKST